MLLALLRPPPLMALGEERRTLRAVVVIRRDLDANDLVALCADEDTRLGRVPADGAHVHAARRRQEAWPAEAVERCALAEHVQVD